MIFLKKYLTRDAPLIFIECWYDGGARVFKKFFRLPFATRTFLYKNGVFDFLTDYKRFEEDLPQELSRWVILNERKLNLVHKALTEGLRYFKKIKKAKNLRISRQLYLLKVARPLLARGFLGVYVTHHWPRYQDQFKQQGVKLFNSKLIAKLTKWRNHEGHNYFVEGVNAVNLLLRQIERLKGWPADALNCLTYQELELAIDKGALPYREIRKRNSAGFLYANYQVIYNPGRKKNIEALGMKVISERIAAKVRELRGIAAYRGKRKGKVVTIYHHGQLGKIKMGDVLVAPMTSPWYLPAIKKATAIVTDEGGVGCHAAIIARELKKPCIIGTKIATKVFKDGDLVEVDANEGIVRMITG